MKKVLEKVLSGTSDKNIGFSELRKLILSFGFNERIKGDHYIYSKRGIIEIINIQPIPGGKAKPYQVKQIRNLIINYKLNKE
jgi:hypothetical protein